MFQDQKVPVAVCNKNKMRVMSEVSMRQLKKQNYYQWRT